MKRAFSNTRLILLLALLLLALLLVVRMHRHRWTTEYEDENIRVEMCETCQEERWIIKERL